MVWNSTNQSGLCLIDVPDWSFMIGQNWHTTTPNFLFGTYGSTFFWPRDVSKEKLWTVDLQSPFSRLKEAVALL